MPLPLKKGITPMTSLRMDEFLALYRQAQMGPEAPYSLAEFKDYVDYKHQDAFYALNDITKTVKELRKILETIQIMEEHFGN